MPSDMKPDFPAARAKPGESISVPRESREDMRRASLRRRLLASLVIVVALGGFSGIVWYAYTKGKESGGEAVVPLIKAESEPVKVRPEKPGGMEIPNQDKLVYNRLIPGEPPPPLERLLPPPEAPVAKTETPPETPVAETETPPETSVAETEATVPPAPPIETPPIETPPIETKESAKKDVGAVAGAESRLASVAPEIGGYRVQLAALGSPEAARRAWALLRAANGDLLGKLEPTVVKADLGAKGIFYRLRVGPLRDRAAGKELCAKLNARKVECLVVLP